MPHLEKKGLVTGLVAAGVGAACMASNDFLPYGHEIADIAAITAELFGAGAFVVAGIKLLPYAIEYAKKIYDKIRNRDNSKSRNLTNTTERKRNIEQTRGKLNKLCSQKSIAPQVTGIICSKKVTKTCDVGNFSAARNGQNSL